VFVSLQLMTVIGNENANKLWEWSIQSDDLIDADADEYDLNCSLDYFCNVTM